jgi:hypothetical protein
VLRPTRTALAAAATTALALMIAVPLAAADTTVRVSADGDGGWVLAGDPTNATAYEFVENVASTGTGSLYVAPLSTTDPAAKFIAANQVAVPVADAESFSFDFRMAGDATADDARQFYVNLYVNVDDSTNFYDCRFDYVATTGSTEQFTTVTASAADAASNVAKRGDRIATCPSTLAEMPPGSFVREFRVNVGDTSTTLSDAGLAAYVDNAVVATTTATTTYDFEVPVVVKQDCKDGGWIALNYLNQGECVSAQQAAERAGR